MADDEARARLAQIQARVAAATPGPWFWTDQPDGVLRVAFCPLAADGGVPDNGPPGREAVGWWASLIVDMEECEAEDINNAAFIAHSRADVAWLLTLVKTPAESARLAALAAWDDEQHRFYHDPDLLPISANWAAQYDKQAWLWGQLRQLLEAQREAATGAAQDGAGR